MALKILNSQPNVSIIGATQDMFKDYRKMLDSFYSNFEPGTIRINRIFKVDMIDDTVLEMQCLTHDGSSVARQSMSSEVQPLDKNDSTSSSPIL
jgi:hypothetical protein